MPRCLADIVATAGFPCVAEWTAVVRVWSGNGSCCDLKIMSRLGLDTEGTGPFGVANLLDYATSGMANGRSGDPADGRLLVRNRQLEW